MDEETADPEWAINNHPAKATLDQFPEGFGRWVNGLRRFLIMIEGGCFFEKDELSPFDWLAMGVIKKIQAEPSTETSL